VGVGLALGSIFNSKIEGESRTKPGGHCRLNRPSASWTALLLVAAPFPSAVCFKLAANGWNEQDDTVVFCRPVDYLSGFK